MRATWMIVCMLFALETLAVGVQADDFDDAGQVEAKLVEVRDAELANSVRLALMRQRMNDLVVDSQKESETLRFRPQPLLHYSEPQRGMTESAIWCLGEEGRPAAILSIVLYRGRLMYEFTATSDRPKSVSGEGWSWTPNAPGFTWLQLPDTERPARDESERLTQMQTIAGSYSATEQLRGVLSALTLDESPIYRYSGETIIDGAIFALQHGNDVEILMFVEAIARLDGEPIWQIGFARMAGARLEVRTKQDDQIVWWQPADDGKVTPNLPSYSCMVEYTPLETAILRVTELQP